MQSRTILRFRPSERHLHWAIAVPFMICFATAVTLVVVYNPHPQRPLRWLVSWTHRLSGLALMLLPPLAMARHRKDVHVYRDNIRAAWGWTIDDVKWLFLMGPSTFSRTITLPPQGKFNAAEKINFIVLMLTYPLYVLTGLLIWMPGAAYLSWLVHLSMAALAAPLMFGHIFMATVNPDTRAGLSGMITGYVDRHWARHHYRRWYDEHHGAGEGTAPPLPKAAALTLLPAPEPVTPCPVPGVVSERAVLPQGESLPEAS